MPFQGGYGPRKFGRKRRLNRRKGRQVGFLNQKYSVMDMAKKAWSMANYIKTLVNVERKFLDVSITPVSISKTATVDWLTNISEGSDYNQRNGISVKGASLFLRGYVYSPATATGGHLVRHIVFIDSDNTGTAPTASDVLEVSSDVNSPINHVNGPRFKILHDKVNRVSTASGGSDITPFKFYVNLSSHVKWSNATTGTKEGHIYSLYLSDTSTAAEEPIFGYDSRFRFIDN